MIIPRRMLRLKDGVDRFLLTRDGPGGLNLVGRVHFVFVVLASLGLAAGTVGWLYALPDGTGETLKRDPHVIVYLLGTAVAGIGLYLAVVLPVLLHALSPGWPFRVLLLPAVGFGLLNLGPLFHCLESALGPAGGEGALPDDLWAVSRAAGLLLLYLLYAGCVFSWTLLPRTPGEADNPGTQW